MKLEWGQKPVGAGGKARMAVYALRSAHHSLIVVTGRADRSLATQGWFHDKSCLVIVKTGAYMTVARPDIADGWLERQPNQHYALQTVSDTDLGVAVTQNLGISRQYHKRVYLGA
jgi:hypothetical protein